MHKPTPSIRRRLGTVAALGALLLSLFPAVPARAAPDRAEFERCLLESINSDRASAGRAMLSHDTGMTVQLREWSEWMRHNDFRHMTSSERDPILPDGVSRWGENIAWSGSPHLADCSAVHDMLMGSDGHRSNILDRDFTAVGIGAHVDGSGWWVTELFVNCVGTFCDDDDSIFEGAIEKMADAGITLGCNPPANDRYCPGQYVTRGAMAAFLVRALGLPPGTSPDFADDDGSVFEGAIERLAAAGITRGCNPPANTRYCPEDYVTRGAMAAFLARAVAVPLAGDGEFVDDDGSVFEGAIARIAAAGITRGCNPPANDRYCPSDYVTRGAMAAFLARALDL